MLSPAAAPFLRHIKRCHNVTLPAGRIPLLYQGMTIGLVDPNALDWLTSGPCASLLHVTSNAITLPAGEHLRDISTALIAQERVVPFNEWFDVRTPEGTIIGQIDRALIPVFGVEASGVHMNGLVRKTDGLYLWVAHRSPHKRLDPSKLDHLVAGGMSSGLTPLETLVKEAEEEAAIPADIAQQAHHASTLHYAMTRPEGLRRDKLYCYDLTLPETFIPHANDGEVESFHLTPIQEVFQRVRESDDFKFNVNLVLLDLFLRLEMFDKQDSLLLTRALHGQTKPA
ncbi:MULTISPECIES: NUDIX hydrolase [Bombella]|uniref:NUDIX domain-containing protein n=2 Tax=Bombella TaxID=1654741 RepID=A0ABT3WK59_9PROT|nr:MULTISPECIES: NUDIX domain-containing protein [Bombella]MCX5614318.1 NUDIX domain-containing protein [Bombella saccharophila]MCX5619366.1 NUDIX domain-containing protein [Bombella pollinis]